MGSVLEAFVRLCPIVFAEKKYVGRSWPEATKYWRKAFNRCASSRGFALVLRIYELRGFPNLSGPDSWMVSLREEIEVATTCSAEAERKDNRTFSPSRA